MMPRSLDIAAIATVLPSALSATVDLPIHFRNSYASVEVNIGTPFQTHMLHFDTGSSSTWVVDQTCAKTCDNGSGYDRNGYNVSASTTGKTLGTYGSIDYFGGVTAGPGVADTFSMPAGVQGDATLTWNQTFLAANESSWRFISADGFLGLAFSTIAVAKTTTIIESLMQQGLLDEPRFGIYYGKEYQNTGANPEGILTIGSSKEEQYVDGELTWIPLRPEIEYQVWRATLSSIIGSSDSGKKQACNNIGDSGRVVFDTGAGSFEVPSNIIGDVYASIGMNWTAIINGKHIPLCSEFNSTWSVTFNFGEAETDPKLTLTGDQLARPGFADRKDACFPPFDDSGRDGFGLFGTPFLHQFYSVWDFGATEVSNYHPRVGFGKLKA
ncbi:pepsin-like aspartic protease [Aspergillus alliaceus]|uniref:pepsin-like aspartic protease n=1 Tax=Petromyces alliaceus TaxID=209559 RepID=UPI0012A5AF72|nr:acid protease [Aspergillus alliaceus]KAB8239090.1 acid protease [Aspergillus alliaceus]